MMLRNSFHQGAHISCSANFIGLCKSLFAISTRKSGFKVWRTFFMTTATDHPTSKSPNLWRWMDSQPINRSVRARTTTIFVPMCSERSRLLIVIVFRTILFAYCDCVQSDPVCLLWLCSERSCDLYSERSCLLTVIVFRAILFAYCDCEQSDPVRLL
jgi:hypothetical protein